MPLSSESCAARKAALAAFQPRPVLICACGQFLDRSRHIVNGVSFDCVILLFAEFVCLSGRRCVPFDPDGVRWFLRSFTVSDALRRAIAFFHLGRLAIGHCFQYILKIRPQR